MSEEPLDELRQSSPGWMLEQEMEVAAEVYGPQPGTALRSELSDEELVERYRKLLGFDVKWET